MKDIVLNLMQLAAMVIMYIFLLGLNQKNSPSRVMQIIKNITARKIFKEYPGIKKQLWNGEL